MAFTNATLCAVLGFFCAEGGEIDGAPSADPLNPDYFEAPASPEAPKPPEPLPPGLLVVADTIDFEFATLGAAPKIRTLALRNTGGSPVIVHYLDVAGSVAFTVQGQCKLIKPNGWCPVNVVFAPEIDVFSTGKLTIGWNDRVSEITLSGEGVLPPAPPPAVLVEVAPVVSLPKPPLRDFVREAALQQAQDVLWRAVGSPVVVGEPARVSLSGAELANLAPAPEWHLDTTAFEGEKTDGAFAGDVSQFPVQRCRIIEQGTSIPLVLAHMINTQISGLMVAHTDRDILSADGSLVLIPARTQFLGKYETLEAAGDTRSVAEWEAFTRPDGARIALSNVGALDANGRAGLTGVVDNREYEKYGTAVGAALISGILTGASAIVDDSNGSASAASQALSSNLSQITAEALRQAANLAPRVTIAKGTLVFAQTGRDWYFPSPYQVVELGSRPTNFDYSCDDGFFRDERGTAQN